MFVISVDEKRPATALHMTGETPKSWCNNASCGNVSMLKQIIVCLAESLQYKARQLGACCQSMHASSTCSCPAICHKCVTQQRGEGYHHGHLMKRGLPVEQHDISILQMPLHFVTWLQVDIAILAPVAKVEPLPILPDDKASPSLAWRWVGTILHQLLQPAAALPWTDNNRQGYVSSTCSKSIMNRTESIMNRTEGRGTYTKITELSAGFVAATLGHLEADYDAGPGLACM